MLIYISTVMRIFDKVEVLVFNVNLNIESPEDVDLHGFLAENALG